MAQALPEMTAPRLLSADLSSADPVPFRGFLDSGDPEAGIGGWAVDLADPDRTLLVELCADAAVVASAPANLRRDDIRRLGFGRAEVGFRFDPGDLRSTLLDRGFAADARLWVRIVDTHFSFRSRKPLPAPAVFLAAAAGERAGPATASPPAGGARAPDRADGHAAELPSVDAVVQDPLSALRTMAAHAAGLPRPAPAFNAQVVGHIECLSWEGDGLVWVLGWMQSRLPLHAPAVLLADGVEHPSALVVATHDRSDLPDGASGILGLLRTDWRPGDADGAVRLIFLRGGAAGARLRLVEKPKLLTASERAGWVEEWKHTLRGPFAEALLRAVGAAGPAAEAPDGRTPSDEFGALMKRGGDLSAAGDHGAALGLFQAALALRPREAGARMAVADALRRLDRHDEADEACRALLADEPEHVGALVSLGHALRRRGDAAGALPLFQAALALKPRVTGVRMAAADTLADLGRCDEAEDICRGVLADEPGHTAALMSLGHSLRRRGDSAGALLLFQAALAREPGAVWARMAVADTLADLNRPDEAEEACRAVLADEPDNFGALMSLGHVARGRADRRSAAAWFGRAAQAAPDAAAPRLALADALRDLGDFDAARAAGEALVARNPDHPEGWMCLGHTERRAGRREAALRAFARASELAPGSPGPLVQMAVEERRLGRPEACERLLERALEADGEDVEALLQLGEHLRLANVLDRALEAFRRAMDSPRPAPWAYLAASQVLVDLGDMGEALRTLDAAEARLGAKADFAAKRAELLRRTGDWAGAGRVAEDAARAWPHHFGIWFERAHLERLRGGQEALAAFLGDAPAGNTHERARVHLLEGLLAAERWRFDEAQGHYARSIELNPDDGWTRVCLAQARLLSLDTEGARDELRALSRLDLSAARMQGRSANISQTHLGQLLDEFTLDARALAGLRALRGLPPEERVGQLLALVRDYPEYTPAAVGLLVALRQSGRLSRAPRTTAPPPGAAATDASPIPRAVAQYWDDSGRVPADLGRIMASWGGLYPGFALRRFSDKEAQAFLSRRHGKDVQAAYRRSRQPAQKADIFRLAYLWSEGGYYADADDRLVGDFEELRFPGARLVLYQEDFGTIGNNLIGAVPGHPLIGRALRLAVEAVNRGDNDILWLSTGPGLLTRAFADLLVEPGREPLAALDDAVVLEHGELQRTVSIHCLVGYKNTERHWSRTAFGRRGAAPAAGGRAPAAGGRAGRGLAA